MGVGHSIRGWRPDFLLNVLHYYEKISWTWSSCSETSNWVHSDMKIACILWYSEVWVGCFGFLFFSNGWFKLIKPDTGQDLFQDGVSSNAVLIPSSQLCCGEVEFIDFYRGSIEELYLQLKMNQVCQPSVWLCSSFVNALKVIQVMCYIV